MHRSGIQNSYGSQSMTIYFAPLPSSNEKSSQRQGHMDCDRVQGYSSIVNARTMHSYQISNGDLISNSQLSTDSRGADTLSDAEVRIHCRCTEGNA